MLIPFIGTTIGAAFVFFLKKSIGEKIQKALKGIWLQVPMFPGLHLMEEEPIPRYISGNQSKEA